MEKLFKPILDLSATMLLKGVASLFACFEKVNERGNHDETNTLPGKPVITFENWVLSKAR
jgi:hypothetical protein